jgi:hypothetical protein
MAVFKTVGSGLKYELYVSHGLPVTQQRRKRQNGGLSKNEEGYQGKWIMADVDSLAAVTADMYSQNSAPFTACDMFIYGSTERAEADPYSGRAKTSERHSKPTRFVPVINFDLQ